MTCTTKSACCTDLINVLIQYELCWQVSTCASCHDFENTHSLTGLQDLELKWFHISGGSNSEGRRWLHVGITGAENSSVHSWMVSALPANVFSAVQKCCQHYYLLDFSFRKEGHFYHLPIICCIALPVSIHCPSSSSWWALYQHMPLFTRLGKYFAFLLSLFSLSLVFFFLYIYHVCQVYETAICILLQEESCVLTLNPKSFCIDVD